MRVRALTNCYQFETYHRAGEEFEVPDGTDLGKWGEPAAKAPTPAPVRAPVPGQSARRGEPLPPSGGGPPSLHRTLTEADQEDTPAPDLRPPLRVAPEQVRDLNREVI